TPSAPPPGQPVPSEDSTVLFLSFAQWFTDGFLMTDPIDRRRTYSAHQIDLSQLYGHTREQTNALRTMSGGLLKSDTIDGETYPRKLYDQNGTRLTEFKD